MEENLRILLAAYEEEKTSLEALVKHNVAEEEYLMAYHHREALSRVNRNIQILKTIDNPFFFEMSNEQRRLNSWKNQLDNPDINNYAEDAINAHIKQHQDRIRHFEKLVNERKGHLSANIIDQAFAELFARKIRYFKIHLNRDKELYFKLTFTNRKLLLVLPNIKQLQKNRMIYQGQMDVMLLNGFQLSASGNKFSRTIYGNTDQIILEFNILFSKIVFDIFYVECAGANHAVEFGPAK